MYFQSGMYFQNTYYFLVCIFWFDGIFFYIPLKRSRVSSGEDDLELFWRENSNPTKPLEPLEEEQAIQTQQSLNPSSIPNTESDYDPSLTELNAILDENPRMEFCPQQQHTVSQKSKKSWSSIALDVSI